MAHVYECTLRPPVWSGIPAGWELVERGTMDCAPLRRDLPLGETRYGVVVYAVQLASDVADRASLRYLGPRG